MRRFVAVAGLLAVLVVVMVVAPKTVAAVPVGFAEFDEFVQSEMQASSLPGISYAIVRDGEVVHVAAFGQADPSGRPMTADTPVTIGSVGKTMTGLAIRQLIETGKVGLDAPVQRYLPWFTLGAPELAAKITIRDLLDHESGLSKADGQTPGIYRPGVTSEAAIRGLTSVVPKPRGTFEYSNLNYITLGVVVEAVSGLPYAQYLDEHVFTPLGMDHSYAAIEPARQDGLAQGHRYVFGLPVAWDEPYPTAIVPAGYQISSAADMGRYLAAMSDHGRYHGIDVVGPTDGTRDYGIDWVPVSGIPSGYTPGHSGTTLNSNAGISYMPAMHLGAVVLTNANPTELSLGTPRGAQDIAFDLLRFTLGESAMTSGPTVTQAYLVVDGALILLAGVVVIELFRLRGWRARLEAARHRRLALVPAGIVDLGLPLAILVGLPLFVGTTGTTHPLDLVGTWEFGMWTLPDICASLIVASALLLLVAVVKIAMLMGRRSRGAGAALGVALLTGVAAVGGCGSAGASPSPLAGVGPVTSEVRAVSDFTIVEVRHGIRLELQIGTPARVEVRAAENLLPITLSSVAESRLVVDASRDYTSTAGITVRVTVPVISELALAGGARGTVSGLAATDFRVRADGSEEMRVSGTTRTVSVTTRGGGIVDLSELTAEEAHVDLAGGAKVTLTARRSVTGAAVGGVVLVVKGDPATLAVDATGGAAVLRQ